MTTPQEANLTFELIDARTGEIFKLRIFPVLDRSGQVGLTIRHGDDPEFFLTALDQDTVYAIGDALVDVAELAVSDEFWDRFEVPDPEPDLEPDLELEDEDGYDSLDP